MSHTEAYVYSKKWINEQEQEKPFADAPTFENVVHTSPISKIEQAAIDVAGCGGRYVRLDAECKSNVYVCIAAISNRPSMYLKMPDTIKANTNVAFEVIKRQGSLFNELPIEMRETRAFLYQAIRTFPAAISEVSHEFQEANVDLVSGALRTGDAEFLVASISKKALQHPDVIKHHVLLHEPDSESWKSYRRLPNEVQSDVNVMMSIFDNAGGYPGVFQDSIFNNVMEAIPQDVKWDTSTMLTVVRRHGVAYCKLPPLVRSRPEFIEAAISAGQKTTPSWYLQILSAVPWITWQGGDYDVAKNEPFFKTATSKITSFDPNSSNVSSATTVNGLCEHTFDYLVESSKDIAIALELHDANGDVFGKEAAKKWFSPSFFDLYLKCSIEKHGFGPSRNALQHIYEQVVEPYYTSLPFAKQLIDTILQIRFNFKGGSRHITLSSVQKEMLDMIKVQHVDVNGNPSNITTGVALFPDELIEYVLCYACDADIIGMLPKERMKDPKFAIAALLKTPKRSVLNKHGKGNPFQINWLLDDDAPSAPSCLRTTIDGWIYKEVCVCAKDENDTGGLTFAYRFNNSDADHAEANIAPLTMFRPQVEVGRYVTIRYKAKPDSDAIDVEYVGSFPLKSIIVLKSWLADKKVVDLVTVNTRHVSMMFMVPLYMMMTEETKADTVIACNLVKNWIPRVGYALIKAMAFATTKQITTPAVAVDGQLAPRPVYYHILKEETVEQALLLYNAMAVKEITDENELHTAAITTGNPTAFERFRAQMISHTMDDAFEEFSQTSWINQLTSDPIVVCLLIAAHFNRIIKFKEGRVKQCISFLRNFEYDLKAYTYGNAERRHKGVKIQTKTMPAGYVPVLSDTEEGGMWSRFVSGEMTDDEFDAIVERMIGWCGALVEITKSSGLNKGAINALATNVHEFLTRLSGPVAVRFDVREFEKEMEYDEEDTAERRRTVASAEIEMDASGVADKQDVLTSSAIAGKRKREEGDDDDEE